MFVSSVTQLQEEIDGYVEDDAPVTYSRLRRDVDDDQEIVTDDQFKCKQQSKKVSFSICNYKKFSLLITSIQLLQSCCGKTNLFKRFADPDKSLGKACYEEVSQLMKQGT